MEHKASTNQISESRRLLENPYAYLDNEGGFSSALQISAAQISESRRLLENQYAHLNSDGGYSISSSPCTDSINLNDIRNPSSSNKVFSFEDIESIVRSLQIRIWQELGTSADPVDALDPIMALEAIGYQVERVSGFGQFDNGHGQAEIAGYIDSSKKHVGFSSQFPSHTRNFTIAHELGHAVLHDAVGMHRDRALNGGIVPGLRDRREIEADKFATYFLMPEKVIRREFLVRFQTDRFTINDDSAFLLMNTTQEAMRMKMKNSRRLARMLAESERYSFAFESMKSRFNVSIEAMAIRLEELNLLNIGKN